MMDAFNGVYLIRLDVDDWSWNVSPFGAIPFIPIFYEIDTNGLPTGYDSTNLEWGPNTPEEMAPVFKPFFSKQ